jgi:hypothetical protein
VIVVTKALLGTPDARSQSMAVTLSPTCCTEHSVVVGTAVHEAC